MWICIEYDPLLQETVYETSATYESMETKSFIGIATCLSVLLSLDVHILNVFTVASFCNIHKSSRHTWNRPLKS
nr:AlNc14C277G10060 [Albugo laibachii Nc14]CCA25770.1 AlNc14C320G10581 [Albugo laibachii Nc14]|eukprot:CCA25770.1 AlNc14C320G10581 [Albugo laibachii Nc14]